MIELICDRCGKREQIFKNTANGKIFEIEIWKTGSSELKVELCNDCISKVLEYCRGLEDA